MNKCEPNTARDGDKMASAKPMLAENGTYLCGNTGGAGGDGLGDGFEDVGSGFGLEDGVVATGLEGDDVEPLLTALVDGDMHFVDPNALVTGAGVAKVALEEGAFLGMDMTTIVNVTMYEAATVVVVDVLVEEVPDLGDDVLVEEVGKTLVIGCHSGKWFDDE